MERFRKLIGKIPTGVLTGVTVAAILWLTLAPHPTGDLEVPLFPGADKIVHMVMFAFLALVALLETMKHRKWSALPLPLIGVVGFICAGFGIGIEFVQRAMGLGRSLEILDMLADSAGAIGAAGVWAMIQSLFVIDNGGS